MLFRSNDVDLIDFGATTGVGVTLDLSSNASQTVAPGLSITLSDGMGIENLFGGTGADTLTGNLRDNVIWGRAGNDKLDGSDGNDVIDGGLGADSLAGGLGNDRETGGAGTDSITGDGGNDILTGGLGSDTFKFTGAVAANNADTVTDFTVAPVASGGDVLNLHDVLPVAAQGQTTAGALGAYLSVAADGLGNTVVKIDSDGAGANPSVTVVTLQGVTGVTLQDLLNNNQIVT